MPSIRRRRYISEVDNEQEELIIPTPSIDQVLQNLASDVLASTAEDKNNEFEDCNSKSAKNSAVPSKSKRKQTFAAESSKLRIIATTEGFSEPEKLTNDQVKNKQNGYEQQTRRTSSRLEAKSKAESMQKSATNVRPTIEPQITSSRVNNSRSASEMLNDLINKSVNNQIVQNEPQSSREKEQASRQKEKRTLSMFPDKIKPRQPQASPYQVPASLYLAPLNAGTSSSPFNPLYQTQTSGDPRVDSTIEQVVSSLQLNPSWMMQRNIVVTRMNNTNDITEQPTITTNVMQQTPQTNTDDDEVEILEEDEEEIAAPFCQNCTTEISLIIQRLDRLDEMVNRMVTMVKKELVKPRQECAIEKSRAIDDGSNRIQNNESITNHQVDQLELELKIMSGSPKEFNLQTLYNHNMEIRSTTFNQLNTALESLIAKKTSYEVRPQKSSNLFCEQQSMRN